MLKENLTTFHILYKSDIAESLINKEAIKVWELKSGGKNRNMSNSHNKNIVLLLHFQMLVIFVSFIKFVIFMILFLVPNNQYCT